MASSRDITNLDTPFGSIEIKIDGESIPYIAKEGRKLDGLCPNVLGRYQIEVDFVPDGKEHEISCTFIPCCSFNRGPESGERLECQGFYNSKRIKMSIGIECEAGYDPNVPDNSYDYDGDYLENGMSYWILEQTKTEKYVFGIAWIDDVGWKDPISDKMQERESETWFGADPSLAL